MFKLEEIAGELRDVVATLEPATYDGRDAARLTEVAAAGEKLFAAAKILLARRAVETRGWVAGSSAASSEQWFAQVSGSSDGAARDALATADRIAELPATEAKLRDGKLSLTQASLVSQGAALDPDAEPKLLRVADRGEIRSLRAEKERVVAAATDADEAQARAHRNRYLRTWTRGIETHGAFAGPTTEVHALLDALEPLRRQAFERGRTGGPRESQDAYRFDSSPWRGAKGRTPATRRPRACASTSPRCSPVRPSRGTCARSRAWARSPVLRSPGARPRAPRARAPRRSGRARRRHQDPTRS